MTCLCCLLTCSHSWLVRIMKSAGGCQNKDLVARFYAAATSPMFVSVTANHQSGYWAKQVGNQYGELITMITMKVVLIHHMLDQSRILTDLLKDIETMDKPNVEVFLNILRLYQKMKDPRVVQSLLSTMLMLVTMMARRTIVKRVLVATNV